MRVTPQGALLAFVGGCGNPNFAYVEYARVASPPGTFTADLSDVTVAVAVSARADATAYDDSGDLMLGDLDLVPEDSRVMEIENSARSRVVFTGISAGTTLIAVLLDGRRVGTVGGHVVRQRP